MAIGVIFYSALHLFIRKDRKRVRNRPASSSAAPRWAPRLGHYLPAALCAAVAALKTIIMTWR